MWIQRMTLYCYAFFIASCSFISDTKTQDASTTRLAVWNTLKYETVEIRSIDFLNMDGKSITPYLSQSYKPNEFTYIVGGNPHSTFLLSDRKEIWKDYDANLRVPISNKLLIDWLTSPGGGIEGANIECPFPVNKRITQPGHLLFIFHKRGVSVLWADPGDTKKDLLRKLKEKEGIEALPSNKATIDDLFKAIDNNDYQEVKSILAQGVAVNSINVIGETPLAAAIRLGYDKIIDLLIKNPDSYQVTPYESTPILLVALRESNMKIARFLLKAGVDIHYQEEASGETAVMFAARQGEEEMVYKLVEMGASMNEISDAGANVLMYAVMSGNLELVKYAFSCGNNINQRAVNGATALSLAKQYKHKKIVQYLLNQGAI